VNDLGSVSESSEYQPLSSIVSSTRMINPINTTITKSMRPNMSHKYVSVDNVQNSNG